MENGSDNERIPSSFFVTEDKFGQRYVVFHIPIDRQTRVLRIAGSLDSPCISEHFPGISAFSSASFLVINYGNNK